MAATEAQGTRSPQEIVARERERAPRVGLAALLAGVLAVVAGVAPQLISNNAPRVYVLDAVRAAAGENIGRPGLATDQILFLNDHAVALTLTAVAQALSLLLIGYVLVFLLDAAMARGATLPRVARLLVMFGAVASAFATVGFQVARSIAAHNFASSSDHSTKAAHDALNNGMTLAFGAVNSFGLLAFAAGSVMVAVAAMRAGLLTRFLGILGAIVGVLVVLGPAMGSSSFIVQAFWLLMTGALLLGRWPGGVPPAWTTGEAVPWPTQQELREQRERQRGGARGRPAPAVPSGPAGPVGEAPSPATSRKKKRKRRA